MRYIMKRLLILLTLCFSFALISCDEDPKEASRKIDNTAEDVKGFLDQFSNKAKEILEGNEKERIKDVIDNIADKSKNIQQDSRIWKNKLEEIKNDKEVQQLLEKYKGDSEEILLEIEDIFRAAMKDK